MILDGGKKAELAGKVTSPPRYCRCLITPTWAKPSFFARVERAQDNNGGKAKLRFLRTRFSSDVHFPLRGRCSRVEIAIVTHQNRDQMITASQGCKGKLPGAWWGAQKARPSCRTTLQRGAIADNVGFLSTLRGDQPLIVEPIHDEGSPPLRLLRRRQHHRGRTSEQKGRALRPQKVRRVLQEGARQVERGGRPLSRTGFGPVART